MTGTGGIAVVAPIVSIFVLRSGPSGPQVLLMRRVNSQAGSWCQAVSKVEGGEHGWQAALRELYEKIDLVPESFYSADICEQFCEAKSDRIVLSPVFVA